MATKILVRFDDICPTMDYKQFQRATNLLDQYGVKPLIGVIPDCKDPDLMIEGVHEDFWEFIKELQSKGYTVAMHGVNHVFDSNARGIVTKRIGSEFAGLPFDVQVEKIKKGKEILKSHGIETDIFFAPAHSYDENTLKALSVNGFKYMSDGKSSKPYIWHGIKCVPCRAAGCPRIRNASHYTAVFHAHEWTRADKMMDYVSFENLLKFHKTKIVCFQEFSNIKSGTWMVQRVDEWFYIYITDIVKPILKQILKKINVI